MREQQERGCVAAEEARRRAKLPKPVLQQLAGLLSGGCPRQLLLTCSWGLWASKDRYPDVSAETEIPHRDPEANWILYEVLWALCWPPRKVGESGRGYRPVRQLVLLEQFPQALPRDMAVRVREEKPKSMKEASEMACHWNFGPPDH